MISTARETNLSISVLQKGKKEEALSENKTTTIPRNSDFDQNRSYTSVVRVALTLRASAKALAGTSALIFLMPMRLQNESDGNYVESAKNPPLFSNTMD